jgi:hypothetical protein
MSITVNELKEFMSKELSIDNFGFHSSTRVYHGDAAATMSTTIKGRTSDKREVVLRVVHENVEDVVGQPANVTRFDGYVGNEYIAEIDATRAACMNYVTKSPSWIKWANSCWTMPVREEV